MKIYKKAVWPKGFQANGVASGIKKSGKLDLALLYSQVPAKASCKFTSNRIWAAPLQINKQHLKKKKDFSAIVVNSGNANCFNGPQGLRDAKETAKSLAGFLGVEKEKVLVASTGIIARRLPIDKIKRAMPKLINGLSEQGIHKAKHAIMTTDTFTKEVTVRSLIGHQQVTICGIAKGAGMIAPNMATMLTFILTDASITQGALHKALQICVDHSFNCITVDGCMSTNDSVMMLANGFAGKPLIGEGEGFRQFVQALETVCLKLAKMIIEDAEGATKFIQIKVNQAKSFQEARKLGLAIANSNLFKTAVYGENPNFGRIVASLGSCGIELREKDLKISVSPLVKKEVTVQVGLKRGQGSAIVYTCDLTPEYIRINAAYN
jgi:glutamate N-acetyltransferase/amino-acid N-acetyltransferase